MAARAIWTGVITFGMVSIPVKLYSATENKDISFNQLHRDCKGRIKQQTFCPTCDRKIEYDEIEKGYEYGKDQYVVITKEDLEKLPVPNKNIVEVTSFIKQDEIDPIFYDKNYYIEPDPAAKKPFALFLKAMKEKDVVAVASIALRSKQRLCALRLLDGTLMLNTLLYPDEIRVQRGTPLPDVQLSDKEMAMANSLIDLMTSDFEPEQLKDTYREALLTTIQAKLEGKEVVEAPAVPSSNVVDLMDALKASMEAMKAQKEAAAATKAEKAEKAEKAPKEAATAGAAKSSKKKAAAG
ncbi:MAG: Ku protein [Candidatus Melainabacteria bacterium]|nr:MAG: Ku protein [Candidatus Melainabacteria bacterium]